VSAVEPSVRALDPRTPVLVGVGAASVDAEAAESMAMALVNAGADAGSPRLLERLDRIAVPQGNWAYPDPARLVAERVGAVGARTQLVELGIPQQSLVNEALAAIAAGACDVAAVVGGEHKRWERDAVRAGLRAPETAQPGIVPDVTRLREGPLMEDVEVVHRLWDPVQQYAMIENALRAAEGLTLDEHRAEVADLWARFNRVARTNPDAAFPAPMEAVDIETASPANRPLAFPYNKWHSTQWTVNQAAALLFCSVETARSLGVPTDRWLFPRVGLESGHAVSLLRRSAPETWPAMEVLGTAATRRLGHPVAEVECIELYSCFPAAVRVQQRALGLEASSTPTITGGMAFAGGPFNNFVLQSTVAVAAVLRSRPRSLGAVTTVSGLLTKPGIGVWSASPDGEPPLLGDLGDAVGAVTEARDVVGTLGGYGGEATVATYTVTYDGMVPSRTVAVCDTDDGRRCVAVSEDRELAAHAVSTELIGSRVRLEGEGLVLLGG
jgi:acetyl-CoA C-acetyltransferase